jgi:hypothetical protein
MPGVASQVKFFMRSLSLAASLLAVLALLGSAACQSTPGIAKVDRHDPEAVLNAYFAAWASNDTKAQTSFMAPTGAELAREPVESLHVLNITPDGASATKRVYSVTFEVKFEGGRSVSMESGEYRWTYTLAWDATRDSWLIVNYGAG